MSMKPDKSSSEVLDDLIELGSQAELTDEELDEELRQEGVDPDHLVKRVVGHVKQLFRDHPPERYSQEAAQADAATEPRPLIGVLHDRTGLKPTIIADRLGVTVTFLSDVNRHAKSLPGKWLDALADRAEKMLEVPRELVIGALTSPFQYARAADRDTSYEDECPTCEKLLSRSGMTAEAQEFWRGLAEEK